MVSCDYDFIYFFPWRYDTSISMFFRTYDISLRVCKSGVCNFIKKETLAQVFSSESCEITKNTFFYRTPQGECFYIRSKSISFADDSTNHFSFRGNL